MNLTLISPPLRAPTAPALGPAVLAACVHERVPGSNVTTLDLNLDLFRRVIAGQVADPCRSCPTAGLSCPRPGLLAPRLQWAEQVLSRLPRNASEEDDTMRAAALLDGLSTALHRCAEAILRPWVEGRRPLPILAREAWLAPWIEQISASRPDVVGVSILGESNLLWGLALARLVREELGRPVILGGSLMSHLDAAELLTAFPWVAALFRGEADRSLPAWMARGEPSGGFVGIPGVAYRGPEGIQVQEPDRQVELDALPAPDFGERLGDYLVPEVVLPYISGRGCYWGRCTFCSHTRPYAGAVRFRCIDKVVDDLQVLNRRYGARTFLFVDEAIPPARARRLFDVIASRNLDLRLGLEGVRPEPAWDAGLLARAHEVGVRWIYVGVETLTQRLLDAIEKGTKVADVLAFLRRCADAGIVAHASYILGLPGQTEAELTAELRRLRPHAVDAGPFALLDGSPMHTNPQRFGVRVGQREVLLRSGEGVVHGPRFDFVSEHGVTPELAEQRYLSDPDVPRIRPHLGECAAVGLSDTPFFRSTRRPAGLDQVLGDALRAVASDVGADVLDAAACLEALGDNAGALGRVTGAADDPERRERLRLHAAACRLQLGDLSGALHDLSAIGSGSTVIEAAAGQSLRIGIAVGDPTRVARAAALLLSRGLDSHRLRLARAILHAAAGQDAEAVEQLRLARELGAPREELAELAAHCEARIRQQTVGSPV